MDSAVRAEDSSSASANIQLVIRETEWASAGVIRITPAEGPSFFARLERISALVELLLPGNTLEGDPMDALLFESRVFLAEHAAMAYLARAEQSRRGLTLKLQKKGFPPREMTVALDWLENRSYLDDQRFASAWLRTRGGRQAEGPDRLLGELLKRGISRDIAHRAVKEHFVERDEALLCAQAGEKLKRLGKEGKKLEDSLSRKGFSPRIIRNYVKNCDE
jgi:regulatory protein